MSRNRRALGWALGASLLAFGLYLALARRDIPSSVRAPDAPDAAEAEGAPELAEARLAAGGRRAPVRERASARTGLPSERMAEAAAEILGANVEEPPSTATLVVDLEPPLVALPPGAGVELRLFDPWGRRLTSQRAIDHPAGLSEALTSEDGIPSGQATVAAGGASSALATWRIERMRTGTYVVPAGLAGSLQPGWMPASVTLAPEAIAHVRLRPLLDGERGVVEVAVLRGEARLPATIVASLWGQPLARVTTDASSPGRFELPVGETVSIEAIEFEGVKSLGRPPARTVVVPAGVPVVVEFATPSLFDVRLRARGDGSPRPDGEKGGARLFLWRIPESGPMAYMVQEDGDLYAGIPFRLGPGRHGALVTAFPGHLPSWTTFDVRPGTEPIEVEVSLGTQSDRTRLRIEQADGSPAAGQSVWIGSLDGGAPADLAVGSGQTDPEGVVSYASLPDGTYHVAINSMWHAVEIRAGAPMPSIRLPPAKQPREPEHEPAHVDGVVLAPDGQPLREMFVVLYDLPGGWGRYTGFGPGGTFSFGGVAPGDVTLEIPWSQLRPQVHRPARVFLHVAPGERQFVVIHTFRAQR